MLYVKLSARISRNLFYCTNLYNPIK